ncbi:prephenate dehydratase [Sulfolobales archaeon HS-7]|nr:prephenate dehydratase [Sulfolobales archaeon HS-7]
MSFPKVGKLYLSEVSNYFDPHGIYYLGPEGSFSHQAVSALSGLKVPVKTISEVFDKISNSTMGLVPVENSLEGPVNETLDNLFTRDGIYVNASLEIEVNLVLAANQDLSVIKRIYSHPHAIAEAGKRLKELGDFEIVQVESTSKAAKLASVEVNAAALCSEFAARLYGLNILERNLTDRGNVTRFFVVSNRLTTSGERTVLFFTVPDVPGSLYNVLREFYKRRVNVKMIYSRPLRRLIWNYYFYLEFEGSIDEFTPLIDDLKKVTQEVKVKGSYTTILSPS